MSYLNNCRGRNSGGKTSVIHWVSPTRKLDVIRTRLQFTDRDGSHVYRVYSVYLLLIKSAKLLTHFLHRDKTIKIIETTKQTVQIYVQVNNKPNLHFHLSSIKKKKK